MNRIKTLIGLMLCISMLFSSLSVSFANSVEEFTGEETSITIENMEEQEEIVEDDGSSEESDIIDNGDIEDNSEDEVVDTEDVDETEKSSDDDSKEENNDDNEDEDTEEENSKDNTEDEVNNNEEINTDNEEVIEDDENSEDSNKDEEDTKEDGENLIDTDVEEEDVKEDNNDEELTETNDIGTFGMDDTVTYFVRYYYDQYNVKTGLDERILVYTDTVTDLVVGEQYTFNAIDIEGYRAPNVSSKTVTISDTPKNIMFILANRKHINITLVFQDSEGNTIRESEKLYEKYIGRINLQLPEVEGYKTPENFYIDIEPTMVHDFDYVIIYEEDDGEIDTEPELDQLTITIHYQDSEGNTIKESDVYTEAKTEPNEYYAPDIEGYIKPEDDTFIRGGILKGTTHVEHTFVYTKELAYDPNEIIYMPDEGLRTILGFTRDRDITRGRMADIKTIDFQYYMHGIPIYDYTGLEYAINVEKIRVYSRVLYDSSNFFEIIQNLDNVIEFESDYPLSESDLSHLANIKSLEKIVITNAYTVDDSNDFSVLENLPNLKYLNLSSNHIEDISTLTGLTSLEELDLSRNSIRSIEGLENLTNLKKLNVTFNNIDFNRDPNKTIKEHFMTTGSLDEFTHINQSPYKLAIITLNHIVNGTGEVIKEPTVVEVYEDELAYEHDMRAFIENIEGYKVIGYPLTPSIMWYGQTFNLNVTYEKEIAEKTGTVIIHYQDTEGNTIKDSDIYTDVRGYYNGYYSDYIEGYTAIYPYYVSIDITEEGAVYEYTFYFSKNEVAIPTATVYIHHEDINGNTIRATEVYYGVTGSDNYFYTGDIYEDGAYYFVNQPNFIQVVVTEGMTEYHHTFVYNKLYEGTVTIHYQDEEGKTLENSLTGNVLGSQTFYALDIDGYKKPVQDSITFTMVDGQTEYTHTFVYTKEDEKVVTATVRIYYKDKENNDIRDKDYYHDVSGTQTYYAPEIEGYIKPVQDSITFTIVERLDPYAHCFFYTKDETTPIEPTEPEKPVEEPKEEEPTTEPKEEPKEEEPTPEPKEEPKEEESKPEEPKEEPKEETAPEEPKEEPKEEEPIEEIEEPKEEEVIPEEPVEETIEEEPTPIEPVVEDKPTPEIKERPEIKVTTEKVEDPTEPEIEEPVIEEPEIEEPAEEEIPNEVKGKIQVRYLFNGQLVDSEELTNLAMGSYNIDAKQIEGYEIIGTTQQEVELTEDMTSITVNFELKVVEKEREPILPIVIPVVGTAGGLIVLLFYFRKRKNLKIYAVEGLEDNEIKRLLGKKNIKVHSDEIVIDLSRELDLIEDEDILRLHLSRSLSVKLQDKKVTIMNGNNKVYEVTIDEYVTTIDIEI